LNLINPINPANSPKKTAVYAATTLANRREHAIQVRTTFRWAVCRPERQFVLGKRTKNPRGDKNEKNHTVDRLDGNAGVPWRLFLGLPSRP